MLACCWATVVNALERHGTRAFAIECVLQRRGMIIVAACVLVCSRGAETMLHLIANGFGADATVTRSSWTTPDRGSCATCDKDQRVRAATDSYKDLDATVMLREGQLSEEGRLSDVACSPVPT